MAAPPPLFSDIVDDDDLWDNPSPDYTTLMGLVGHGTNADRNACARSLIGINQHSPTVVGFQLDGDQDHIYIGYNPTFFPTDPTSTTPFDDHVMIFIGNNLNDAMPMVFEDAGFTRTAGHTIYNSAYMTGANGHAAPGGAVYRFDTQAGGAADCDDNVRVRPIMLMPKTIASLCLTNSPNGRYTLRSFRENILNPELASADIARTTPATDVATWWRGICTNHGGAQLAPS